MSQSSRAEKIHQAAIDLFTDDQFIDRIMSIASREEQAKMISLGEAIMNSINQTNTLEYDSDDLSEDPNQDPKTPYEYCENSGQYGY